MRRSLFLRIVEALQMNVPYFVQRWDATGMLGLSSLQKVTAAVRLLAYDVAGDVADEYLRIGASTPLECLKIFCRAVYDIFSEQYLRQPTREDVARITAENARRGFPGMLGSIDFASKYLWIWHAYFGVPGCNNDINVLERSNLFLNLAKGEAPPVRFDVNGNEYNMRYYLADGVYPSWASFVKTIPRPFSQKHKIFAKYQEGVRKDVERAFGVLQARRKRRYARNRDFPARDNDTCHRILLLQEILPQSLTLFWSDVSAFGTEICIISFRRI
ncbi:uncharacterized protein [Henckelia pumila]|uniref:uncharacterized protein n=1 Tax=Henckelia pumila TaxID=405737 RepID=UPI003C6DF03A